jgi:hypothetical protein
MVISHNIESARASSRFGSSHFLTIDQKPVSFGFSFRSRQRERRFCQHAVVAQIPEREGFPDNFDAICLHSEQYATAFRGIFARCVTPNMLNMFDTEL